VGGLKLIKKVTFNKGGSGAKSGRIILPSAYLEILKITEEENEVEVLFEDNKIIIKKKESIDMDLKGKKWCELSESTKIELLSKAYAVNGIDGTEVCEGDCIVDFENGLSVSGKVVDDEIVINNEAVLYSPID